MAERIRDSVPAALIATVETARKDLLALFRTIDRLFLAPCELPQRLLRQLLELDADLAEMLLVLDRPTGMISVRAMLADTNDSLRRVPETEALFFSALPPSTAGSIREARVAVRASLRPSDGYHSIPGIDPTA